MSHPLAAHAVSFRESSVNSPLQPELANEVGTNLCLLNAVFEEIYFSAGERSGHKIKKRPGAGVKIAGGEVRSDRAIGLMAC